MMTFKPAYIALRGGKTKKQFIAEQKAKGNIARYTGEPLVDEEGNILRHKGFHITEMGQAG